MQMSLSNLVFQLSDKKPFSFRDARGVYLECIEGIVWLTVDGQPGDFLMFKGEGMRIESNGHALVEGLPSGAVRLISEATASDRRLNLFDWRINRTLLLPRFACVLNK